jgi:SH3 domain-containing YSC84-like protein 1
LEARLRPAGFASFHAAGIKQVYIVLACRFLNGFGSTQFSASTGPHLRSPQKGHSVKTMTAVAVLLALALPSFAQQKEAERLNNSARVFKEIVSDNKGLPTSILDKAECVLIFPSVKKIAVGIGGSYGRGVLVCRTGANMDGGWGAPAMYKLDEGSLGIQLGSTATDFVLLVMNHKGATQILNGKTKLGANAAAAAGPTGADAQGYNAEAMKVDVLTYSRSKGLFAGVSLTGASMDGDEDADKALYGKPITPSEIINGTTPPAAAKTLIETLDSTSGARRS